MIFFLALFILGGFGFVIENNEGGARHLISCPFPLLQSKKLFLTLSYPKLLFKPLDNRCFVDMQEQVSLLVPYHLCRNVIGKSIAPVLIGVKPPTIIDGLAV